MNNAVKNILERDSHAKAQFERIAFYSFMVFLTSFLPLLIFQMFAFPSISHFIHMATFSLAVVSIISSREGLQRFMYTSVFFGFTWMLYVNATLQLKSIDSGVIDPIRAAAVAATSQLALTFVSIIDGLWKNRPISVERKTYAAQQLSLIEIPIFAIILFSGLLNIAGYLPPIVAESLRYLLPIPIVLRFLRLGANWNDYRIVTIVSLSFFVAITSNNRADFFNVVLILLAVYIMFAKRPPSILQLVFAYISIKLIDVFSGVLISVRPLKNYPAEMVRDAVNRLFNYETLYAIINPFFKHSATLYFDTIQTGVNYATPEFFSRGTSSIIDRLTILPFLDVVTGRLNAPPVFDFSLLLRGSIVSAFPDIGQEKLTMFSDRIIWDLALRPRESVGRPLITFQGEAWSIGGFEAVFAFTFSMFLIWLILYRILRDFIKLETVTIGIGVLVLAYSTLSTSLISVTFSLVRMPVQLIIFLSIILILFNLFSGTHQSNVKR